MGISQSNLFFTIAVIFLFHPLIFKRLNGTSCTITDYVFYDFIVSVKYKALLEFSQICYYYTKHASIFFRQSCLQSSEPLASANEFSANLIYQSWPVDMAGKRVLKAKPKIYNADAAIRNAVLMDDALLTDPVEMGKIVETAVYKHVAAFYYQRAASVGYFRGGKISKEIDIVVDNHNSGNILIVVKYREGAPISDEDAISELCSEAAAAIVVTKAASDFGVHNTKSGKDMLRIPAFAFLYLLGHAEKNGYKGID